MANNLSYPPGANDHNASAPVRCVLQWNLSVELSALGSPSMCQPNAHSPVVIVVEMTRMAVLRRVVSASTPWTALRVHSGFAPNVMSLSRHAVFPTMNPIVQVQSWSAKRLALENPGLMYRRAARFRTASVQAPSVHRMTPSAPESVTVNNPNCQTAVSDHNANAQARFAHRMTPFVPEPVTVNNPNCQTAVSSHSATVRVPSVHLNRPFVPAPVTAGSQSYRMAVSCRNATALRRGVHQTNSSVAFNVQDNPSVYQPNARNRAVIAALVTTKTTTVHNALQRLFLRHVERPDNPTARSCCRSYSMCVACNFVKTVDHRLKVSQIGYSNTSSVAPSQLKLVRSIHNFR